MGVINAFINGLPLAVTQGLIWGIMAIGVFITYKVLDIADLTVDGSLATGGAVFVVLNAAGVPTILGLLIAFLAGCVAGFMTGMLKGMLKKNVKTMLAALLLKNELKEFKAKLDYTEYGGAPILGVTKGVIKAHGSSNAKAFKNAIRQAKTYAENNVSEVIAASLVNEGE